MQHFWGFFNLTFAKNKHMKKIFTFLGLISFFLAKSQSTTVVISQVYGGGDTASATYNTDYIELHNISGTSQDISGYKIMYGSSTGNLGSVATNVFTFPSSGIIIPAGGYLLVAAAPSTGLAPIPVSQDYTFTLSMSGTNGKIAFGTSAMTANTTYALQPSGSVIDFVGYGSANESETSPTGVLSTTTGAVRNTNGCTETNNNNTNFTVTTNPVPRNSTSAAVNCTVTPTIGAPVSLPAFTTSTVGVASASQLFNLTASNLTPASGNLTITPTTNFEFSFDNTTFFTAAQTIAYTGGALSSTPIYVRLAATAPQGVSTGTLTISGGSAPNAVVNLTGGVTQNYYNTKANLGLTNVGTWSTTLDGTGASPANFTSGYQIFNIVNQTNANYTGVWNVNYSGSKVVVGDGTNPVTFTILSGIDSVTSGTKIDVLNNGTLRMQNNRIPTINTIATGSTIDFAQSGVTNADTIRIPNITFYNLTLTNGIKYFSKNTSTTTGFTSIKGNLVIDGVVSVNGANSTPFSTIEAFGNVTMQNGAAFEPNPSGDLGRITLKMNGAGPTQNLSAIGGNIILFRLQRDSVATCTINLVGNSNLTLGNASSGGLSITPLGTTFATGTGTISFVGAAVSTTAALGKITASGTSLAFTKSTIPATNGGTLKFNLGSTLNNVTMNMDPSITADNVTFANDVTMTGVLTLTKGKIIVPSGATLTLASSVAANGASSASFVDGAVKRSGNTPFTYPVGKGNKYAPVDFSGFTGGNTYTVQYFNTGYSNFTVDPTTLATYPNYDLSHFEYWNIVQQDAGTVDLNFNYTDANSYIYTPNAIRLAHFDGTDWNDIAGTPGFFNSTTFGSVSVTGVSQFSPFTFSALTSGIIPVIVRDFTVTKVNGTTNINWVTEQEVNSNRFEIEKSVDGRNWNIIATVGAAGNSSIKKYYNASDINPASGVNYYRIKLIDNDGKFTYTIVKSVYFGKNIGVVVSPNPVKDILTIYLPTTSKTDVKLYNAGGQLVKKITDYAATLQLHVNGIAKGVYTLVVTNDDIIETRKIIID